MFEQSLISGQQHWLVLAALLLVVFTGLWAEKTRWGAQLSSAVIIILGALVLSNLSIIPSSAPIYDMVWSYFVPLAIPLLLFKADLRKIIRETGPTLLAFSAGALGTVLGTILAFHLIPLGEEGWKLASIFCATYIGGSVNYVGTAEAVQMKSGGLLAAGIAADNLVMTMYFLILFALPSIKFLRKRYVNRHANNNNVLKEKSLTEGGTKIQKSNGNIELLDMAKAFSISAVLCAIGYWSAEFSGIKPMAILIITALAVLLATLFPRKMEAIKGADQLGTFLMQIFFAVIGASANIYIVLKKGPILFVFAALILLVHLLFLLVIGKWLKLDLIEIVIASNANLGGPTTAAAMAVARKWETLVIPAILCGTLGYAAATFIAVTLGFWLK